MAQVDAVFCHHRLFGMVRTDVSVMFFNPCLNQTSSLSIVQLPILVGNVVSTWPCQRQIILNGSKKLDSFLGGRPTVLLLCSGSTLLMRLEVVPTSEDPPYVVVGISWVG